MFGHCIPGVHRARLLSAAYSDEGAARNQDPSSLDKVSYAALRGTTETQLLSCF
jgi:hypothetical protein